MAKHDKQKRAWGGAIKRTKPSAAGEILAQEIKDAIHIGWCPEEPRVLDYGCGYGFDADHFGWDSFDPYYRPNKIEGPYDFIICSNVINALSRRNRHKVIDKIKALLKGKGSHYLPGMAYLTVPRNIPKTGKLGIHHSLQNYVVLTLPTHMGSHETGGKFEIYQLTKGAKFKDKTKEFLTARDKRASK